jgi:hypothetical protein
MQARLGQVKIASDLGAAEKQLRNLTPDGKKSDRADAVVHLVRNLAGLSDEKEIARVATEQEQQEAAEASCALAADINASLRDRLRGKPADDGEPMKVPGALPGDPRYPGPSPRQVVRGQSGWRQRGAL